MFILLYMYIQTYNTDQQTPDSAGTATAFFCGVKTKAGAIGVDDQVEYGNCASIENAAVESVMTLSQQAGMKGTRPFIIHFKQLLR